MRKRKCNIFHCIKLNQHLDDVSRPATPKMKSLAQHGLLAHHQRNPSSSSTLPMVVRPLGPVGGHCPCLSIQHIETVRFHLRCVDGIRGMAFHSNCRVVVVGNRDMVDLSPFFSLQFLTSYRSKHTSKRVVNITK